MTKNLLNQLIKLCVQFQYLVLKIGLSKDYDADFTIDMNRTIEIKNENIHSKCGWSPFDGYN